MPLLEANVAAPLPELGCDGSLQCNINGSSGQSLAGGEAKLGGGEVKTPRKWEEKSLGNWGNVRVDMDSLDLTTWHDLIF